MHLTQWVPYNSLENDGTLYLLQCCSYCVEGEKIHFKSCFVVTRVGSVFPHTGFMSEPADSQGTGADTLAGPPPSGCRSVGPQPRLFQPSDLWSPVSRGALFCPSRSAFSSSFRRERALASLRLASLDRDTSGGQSLNTEHWPSASPPFAGTGRVCCRNKRPFILL